jgi:major vault protein
LELQALSAAVESTGQAKAEAQSRAESARIEGEAAVEQGMMIVCLCADLNNFLYFE